MTMTERALRTVGGQLRFEMAEVAARVAAAAALVARSRQAIADALARRDDANAQLQEAQRRADVNPALLATLRRVCAGEIEACAAHQASLAWAQRQEARARDELAQLRNRDRLVLRGLADERRKDAGRRAQAALREGDEAWLQHARSRAR